jgi:hypothetical protein
VGDRSWQESLTEVDDSLNFLRKTLDSLPASAGPNGEEAKEINKLTRRIRLLAYAQSRAQNPGHQEWVKGVRREMSDGERSQDHSYSPEELRKRARVS